MLSTHLRTLARYNQWMNSKVYQASAMLPAPALFENRGAFFGSIFGTLNHIMVGDRIWLRRFAEHPARHPALQPLVARTAPTSLTEVLYPDLAGLTQERQALDALIIEWTQELTDADLQQSLVYRNMKGVLFKRQFGPLLLHFFNHQTHHRGQTTTLLSQAGVDVGVTDLLELLPQERADGD